MSRVDNWRTLLAQFIDERRNRAFEWGSHDCCLFVADWIKTATGYDPADIYRGRYNSAHGAHRLTAPFGGLAPFVKHCLREVGRPISCAEATAGDIIVRDSGDGDCIGIVLGAQSAFVAKHGLEFLPTGIQADARFWKL